MPVNPLTAKILAKDRPDETVLDGGPAKSKAQDRGYFEQMEKLLGGVAGVRKFAQTRPGGFGQFLEADWVATDKHLYYVHFNAAATRATEWRYITRAEIVKKGLMGTATVRVHYEEGDFDDYSMSSRAAASLVQIASERSGR